jgi:hypothetical protein
MTCLVRDARRVRRSCWTQSSGTTSTRTASSGRVQMLGIAWNTPAGHARSGGTTTGHDERWERLTAIAATGQVPRPETAPSRGMAIRLGWAAS